VTQRPRSSAGSRLEQPRRPAALDSTEPPRIERRGGAASFPDAELAVGTSAHYDDPAYYGRAYARRTADVDYYTDLASRACGPVLEYGCGNGRISLAMARVGVPVVGVDISRPMLDDLALRLAREPSDVRVHVRLVEADMRELSLDERFALVICPFNAFLHLYERADVEAFLARVKAHLAPGGRFVFDVSMPDPSELARPAGKLYRARPFVYPAVGRVRYGERFEYDPLRQLLFVSMEFEPESGAPSFSTPLVHRQFYPRELEALLHYNGFEIVELVGDFAGEVSAESCGIVYVCQVRSGSGETKAR
jgi:SAM-dependent methyltransferase